MCCVNHPNLPTTCPLVRGPTIGLEPCVLVVSWKYPMSSPRMIEVRQPSDCSFGMEEGYQVEWGEDPDVFSGVRHETQGEFWTQVEVGGGMLPDLPCRRLGMDRKTFWIA